MYVLRLLVDEDIPLNQGVLAPVEIDHSAQACSIRRPAATPEDCPAVVGGNVETSQRVVDVLLGALGLAARQPGDDEQPALRRRDVRLLRNDLRRQRRDADGHGADAVHTHMTNTRLTDPEVLEHRYPVRVRRFAIRRGSGGTGQHRGGDGMVRQIEFLRPLNVSILSQRRGPYRPFGLHGGESGERGKTALAGRAGRKICRVVPSLRSMLAMF